MYVTLLWILTIVALTLGGVAIYKAAQWGWRTDEGLPTTRPQWAYVLAGICCLFLVVMIIGTAYAGADKIVRTLVAIGILNPPPHGAAQNYVYAIVIVAPVSFIAYVVTFWIAIARSTPRNAKLK